MKSPNVLISILLATAAVSTASAESAPKVPSAAALNRTVSVIFPDSEHVFPPGAGAEIANSQCMICHSAGMVTRQPPLRFGEWKAEINKMRNVYGAPMPEEQVEELARYLAAIKGKQ
ncbi:MAG: cytochrome c [Paraburkholderia sp.]|uniref:c-type cytochrome n=1 Tax=Paraburkholderia sp. TaxID=1926495 RepID=UPI003C3E143F